MSDMKWVVWEEWCEMSSVIWVVWDEWWVISDVRWGVVWWVGGDLVVVWWMLWDESGGEMSGGERYVVGDEWCEMRSVVGDLWRAMSNGVINNNIMGGVIYNDGDLNFYYDLGYFEIIIFF